MTDLFVDSFIYFRDGNGYFILYRFFPYYVGEILTDAPDKTSVYSCQLPGYWIWINFAGTIDSRGVLLRQGWKKELEGSINKMAEFFMLRQLTEYPLKYKKFRM